MEQGGGGKRYDRGSGGRIGQSWGHGGEGTEAMNGVMRKRRQDWGRYDGGNGRKWSRIEADGVKLGT